MDRVIWIVTPEYEPEAQASAASVSRAMPQLERTIFVSKGDSHPKWFVESISLLISILDGCAGDKILWLDSDTYMIEAVPELFNALVRTNLIIAHAPGHHTAPTVASIPDLVPEYNIGVIAMNNNEITRGLWSAVHELQITYPGVYGNNDQAPLREVLWNGYPISYLIMPSEYNCRFNFGCQVRDKVKILHGRGDYGWIAESINAGYVEGDAIAPRIWLP